MIGNVASVESSTCSCRSGLPWSTNPKIEVASRRIGKIASVA